MRRLLLAELPLFSRLYGIHPWQIERMTMREISEYQTHALRLQGNQGV